MGGFGANLSHTFTLGRELKKERCTPSREERDGNTHDLRTRLWKSVPTSDAESSERDAAADTEERRTCEHVEEKRKKTREGKKKKTADGFYIELARERKREVGGAGGETRG